MLTASLREATGEERRAPTSDPRRQNMKLPHRKNTQGKLIRTSTKSEHQVRKERSSSKQQRPQHPVPLAPEVSQASETPQPSFPMMQRSSIFLETQRHGLFAEDRFWFSYVSHRVQTFLVSGLKPQCVSLIFEIQPKTFNTGHFSTFQSKPQRTLKLFKSAALCKQCSLQLRSVPSGHLRLSLGVAL